MVTVRTATQQGQTAAQPNVDISTRISADALGASLGRGLQQFGAALDRVNDKNAAESSRNAARAKGKQDASIHNKAVTDLKDGQVTLLKDPETGYLNRELEDAFINKDKTLEDYDALVDGIIEKIPTDEGKDRFRLTAARERVSYRSATEGHAGRELDKNVNNNLNKAVNAANAKAVALADDPNAVIQELGAISDAENVHGAFNRTSQEDIDEKIEIRKGALYSNVISSLLTANNPEQALEYLDDFFVTDSINPVVLADLRKRADNQMFIKDSTIEVKKIIAEQLLEQDFSQNTLDELKEEAAVQLEGDKLVKFESILEAGWRDATNDKRKRDNEGIEQFIKVADKTTRLDALTQAQNLPEHLVNSAVDWVEKHKFPGETGEVKDNVDTAATLILKQEIRNAIGQGLINSVGDLQNKFGTELSAADFEELSKLFTPGAEAKRENDIDGFIKSALQSIDPTLAGNKLLVAAAPFNPLVKDLLSGSDPTRENIESIVKLLSMDTEVINTQQEGLSLGQIAGRASTFGLSAFFEDDTTVDTPEERAENFANLVPLVIPDAEKENVLQKMRADGLDPKVFDPREYYRTVFLKLPIIGERTFGPQAQLRARTFVNQRATIRESQARRELASNNLREQFPGGEFKSPTTDAVIRGSSAFFLELDQLAAREAIPQWLSQNLMDQGDIINRQTGEPEPALLQFHRALDAADDKTIFIKTVGSRVLAEALNG